jgi:hypothetical protein
MVDRGGGLGCCEEQEEGGGRERFTLFLWIMTRSCLLLLGSRRSRRLSHFKTACPLGQQGSFFSRLRTDSGH